MSEDCDPYCPVCCPGMWRGIGAVFAVGVTAAAVWVIAWLVRA